MASLHGNHGWGPPSREWRPDTIHCISSRMGAVLIEAVVIRESKACMPIWSYQVGYEVSIPVYFMKRTCRRMEWKVL